MPADALAAFLAAAAASPTVRMHSLLVRVGGVVRAEVYWDPYTAGDRALVYSASKTVTATAIGLAVAEGHLNLTDRVADLLPDSVPDDIATSTASITVHHLLSMSTGHDTDTIPAMLRAPDMARAFLELEPETPVGSRHVYDNGASWMLGEIMRRRVGESLMDYLRPRLFEPLGISPTWDVDAQGREFGFSGCHLTTRALSAIGEVYLRGGVYEGRRLLPADWVEKLSSVQIDTRFETNPDWRYGYGYQVWHSREGYRLDGAYGQFCFVLPERDATITCTSAEAGGGQPLVDLVFDHLVPGLGEQWATPEHQRLRLPYDSGAEGTWSADAIAPRASLAVGAVQEELPEVTAVALHRTGSAWELALRWNGEPLNLSCGSGEWSRQTARTVPVAMAAGALSSGDARVLLCFKDTPHVFVLQIGPNPGIAWQTWPRHASALASLRAWDTYASASSSGWVVAGASASVSGDSASA